MDILKYIISAALVLIVYINILASISIIKSDSLSGLQKVGQFIFAWLLPILGAKFVLHILSDSEPEAVRWIPQRGHGWLIISGVYHDSLHGREHSEYLEGESGMADSGSLGDGGGSD